jgi:amino acid transporter
VLALCSTTSKSTAAVAACLTILSYVATAVVSGSEAIEYASHVWSGMPITIGTILLLAVFAVLNLMGISDSATVALAIFVTHLVTVAILVVSALVWVGQHGFHVLQANYWASTQPTLWRAIIFGFSSAMLGVSGFESSANFVEEQKSGVFVKTLRNMWLAVSLINPSVTFLALCIIPQQEMRENQSTVMAEMGRIAAGEWLEKLVSADAFLVLSGGVLTSFVGVTGLCRRLALDRCLPQFLLGRPTRTRARTMGSGAMPTRSTLAISPLTSFCFPLPCLCTPQPRTNGATRTTGSSSVSSACVPRCTSSSTGTSRRSPTCIPCLS